MDNETISALINKQIDVNEDFIKLLQMLNEEINTLTLEVKLIKERLAQ